MLSNARTSASRGQLREGYGGKDRVGNGGRTLVSAYRAAALELRAAGPICDVQWTGAWEHGMGCVVHGNNERRGVSRRDAYVCGREKKTTGAVWVNEEVTSSFQGMTPRIAANDCISRRVGTAHEP